MAESSQNEDDRRARNRISVDLKTSKAAWLSWCQSVSLPPSEALRELVSRLKPGQWPQPARGNHAPPLNRTRSKTVAARPKVPLSDDEWADACALAQSDGMTVPRWIVALIRAHVEGKPQIGPPTIDALRASNLELQAIGRNLNQVARALNGIVDHLDHGRLSQAAEGLRAQRGDHILGMVRQVKATVDQHLPIVSAVLTDNVSRWRVRRPSRQESSE
jgi:hypothetical protein